MSLSHLCPKERFEQVPAPVCDHSRPSGVQAGIRGTRQLVTSMVDDKVVKHQYRDYYQYLRRIPKEEEILEHYWVRDLGKPNIQDTRICISYSQRQTQRGMSLGYTLQEAGSES